MAVGMPVNSLPEKKSSNPLLWGAGIGVAGSAVVNAVSYPLAKKIFKEKFGIDSFESAKNFVGNKTEIKSLLGSISSEEFLNGAKDLFQNPCKSIVKNVALWGVIGLAIGGIVALCKSNKN